MSYQRDNITLYGRIFLIGDIQLVTGLHVGAGRASLQIGGMDNPVVRDPLTNRPYIPGSSLKGKLRSLLEKRHNLTQNTDIGEGVVIHICKKPEKPDNSGKESKEQYQAKLEEAYQTYCKCPVCPVFGVPGEHAFTSTRLLVRDVQLGGDSVEKLQAIHTDLPFTEAKWEAAIDRVTSAATPRPMERVPAGAVFSPMELVFNVYEEDDLDRFVDFLEGLSLLEDDYLGGLGSRGSGKIALKSLKLTVRTRDNYQNMQALGDYIELRSLLEKKPDIAQKLKKSLPIS